MEETRKGKIVSVIIIAFLLALGLRIFIVEGFLVQGESMNPTILSGDYALINKFIYRTREPALGDVVVAHTRETKTRVIKRIEAVPGDKIKITVDNFYTVDPGEYFLLGDNREESIDSRIFGGVDKWSIQGKVWGVISFKRGKFIKF